MPERVEIGRERDGIMARIVAGTSSVLVLASGIWFSLAPGAAPLAIGAIAAVCSVTMAVVLARYSAVNRIDADAVRIVGLLGGRTTVPRSRVDTAVVTRLLLPSRTDGSAKRIVFLARGEAVASASPIRAFSLHDFAVRGLMLIADEELRTPHDFARRYPGAVNRGERAVAMLPLLAVVSGAAIGALALIR